MSSLSCSLFQQPAVGDTIDIFVLRSELHKGAMATLFLAEDLLSRQQVVLKIPCGDILNHPILLYHYQNEERISRLVDHPGIVRFIHRERSRQYIIMEYVFGQDLRSRVGKGRRLELTAALGLMDHLCSAVGYLHSQSIVHLDLKPENILCLKDGTLKVIDFGLAGCRHLPDLLTFDLKNPQGTPWYIAPEQLLGERADPRCDIYSMGMLLYEMLTGSLPWPRSSDIHVARRRLRQEPAPPRHYNSEIPPQIQTIILRAIARHAGDRYASVGELQQELQCWQELPVTERGSRTRPPPWWRRFFPGKAIRKRFLQQDRTCSGTRPQIIAAVIDSPRSDPVLVEVKKLALIRSAEVTLVHVVEEESDSHVRRYGIAVEGEQLMVRLEHAVQLFRRCSIDPSIRLIRGKVVEVLRKLCADLDAELLVLGESRKKGGMLGSASVRRRLEKNSSCPLLVAEEEQFSPSSDLAGLQPDQLTPRQVLASDIFLVDLWYEYLHLHTDFIYRLLLYPEAKIPLGEEYSQFGSFLATLKGSAGWGEAISLLMPIYIQFQEVAGWMAGLGDHDHAGLQALYIKESLPLSCKFKSELGQVSLLLRAHLENPPPSVPFLTDHTCPVSRPNLACYGPLLRVFNLDQDLCFLAGKEKKKEAGPEAMAGD